MQEAEGGEIVPLMLEIILVELGLHIFHRNGIWRSITLIDHPSLSMLNLFNLLFLGSYLNNQRFCLRPRFLPEPLSPRRRERWAERRWPSKEIPEPWTWQTCQVPPHNLNTIFSKGSFTVGIDPSWRLLDCWARNQLVYFIFVLNFLSYSESKHEIEDNSIFLMRSDWYYICSLSHNVTVTVCLWGILAKYKMFNYPK